MQKYFLLLALLLAANAGFASKQALITALNAWAEDPAAAADTYGDIGTWDVTAVTDFSHIFCGSEWDAASGCRTAMASFNAGVDGRAHGPLLDPAAGSPRGVEAHRLGLRAQPQRGLRLVVPVEAHLQPYVTEAATVCDGGCNRM